MATLISMSIIADHNRIHQLTIIEFISHAYELNQEEDYVLARVIG